MEFRLLNESYPARAESCMPGWQGEGQAIRITRGQYHMAWAVAAVEEHTLTKPSGWA